MDDERRGENLNGETESDHEPDVVRLHAIVHGIVQGVGFRAATQREAARQPITGWVANRWDGTVETVAEGPRAVLEQFEQFLHRGPRAAHVERVEIVYEDASGEFSRFSIRY